MTLQAGMERLRLGDIIKMDVFEMCKYYLKAVLFFICSSFALSEDVPSFKSFEWIESFSQEACCYVLSANEHGNKVKFNVITSSLNGKVFLHTFGSGEVKNKMLTSNDLRIVVLSEKDALERMNSFAKAHAELLKVSQSLDRSAIDAGWFFVKSKIERSKIDGSVFLKIGDTHLEELFLSLNGQGKASPERQK